MRRLALLLLLAPPLLAPVRYQSGEDTITLNPSQGPSKRAFELPSAAPLGSPTVIMLSPTVVSGTLTATPARVTPTAPAAAKPSNLMPETSAMICLTALKTVADLTLLSYSQQRQPAAIKLVVAANLGAAEASNLTYPNLREFTEAFGNLRFNTPQKRELNSLVATAQSACANPRPAPVAPGSRIPIPRPN